VNGWPSFHAALLIFKDWTKVFPDALNAQVIAERLTERAECFVLEKGFRIART
jgi:hypothetical protein